MYSFKQAADAGIDAAREKQRDRESLGFGRGLLHAAGMGLGAGIGGLGLGAAGAYAGARYKARPFQLPPGVVIPKNEVDVAKSLLSLPNMPPDYINNLKGELQRRARNALIGGAAGGTVGSVGGAYLGHLATRPSEEE